MALMESVTRRGTFLDLGQMDQTEFRTWWFSMLREGPQSGYLLLDVYECPALVDATAVAYTETLQGLDEARKWWERETDGECEFLVYMWVQDDHQFYRMTYGGV